MTVFCVKLKLITHCLVKGSSPQGYRELPVCKKCAIDIDNESLYFWDANGFVELVDLSDYEGILF